MTEKIEKISIAGRIIGKAYPVFVIAEAGVNHNGDYRLAEKLIDAAKQAGADAVKFQTFKAENLVTEKAGMADYQKENLNSNESQIKMLKKYELVYSDFKKLKQYCDKKGILFLSTPHTEDAAEYLNSIVPCFKLGSGDLTNTHLLKKIADYHKPIIISTGMADLEEIKQAINLIYSRGNKEVIALHCTSNYPTKRNNINLRAMQTMQKELNCLIGYSDHTLGIDISLMAAKLGAVLIEKHFTLDKSLPGPDHKASLDPVELSELVEKLKLKSYPELDEEVLGSSDKKPNKSELPIADIVRKSIVARTDIPANTKLTEDMLAIKRPGTGIQPKYFDDIVGRITKTEIKKDSLLKLIDLENNNSAPKIFVASFNRASDGAISLLLEKMEKNNMLTKNHEEADYILAVGDRIETFDFVLKRFQENKKIIHLWAGEISQGTHDEVYRHAMTIMSEIQLCTNPEAQKRVIDLCKSVDKKPNAYVIGNLMLDNMKIDKTKVPKEQYDLILYNPPTSLSESEILKEIEQVKSSISSKKHIWIEPNGDFKSNLIREYVTHSNIPRPQFLGLMSSCNKFITNSSCMFYEAPFLLKPEQIIPIGKRNIDRKSKYGDMQIKNASDNIIKIFEGLR